MQLALFGTCLAHSRSPQLHQQFAKQAGVTIDYQLIEVNEHQFATKLQDFFRQGGHGANITFPFKQKALILCDQLTDAAKQSGAVNTLYKYHKKLVGDNTDGKGFIQDCHNKKISFDQKRIIILGAGGAARGILAEIAKRNTKQIIVVNRHQQKLNSLHTAFPQIIPLSYERVSLLESKPDIVVNATSASLQNAIPALSPQWIPGSICYDLAYDTRGPTIFMQWADNALASQTFDGYGMLIEQARLAFKRWFTHSS